MVRSIYSETGFSRSALFLLVVADFVLLNNVVLLTFINQGSLVVLFQLVHILTITFGFIVMVYGRRARVMLNILLYIYITAVLLDAVSLLMRAALFVKAWSSTENECNTIRQQVIMYWQIFLLSVVDGFGAHFADRLRVCYAEEVRTLEALKDANEV